MACDRPAATRPDTTASRSGYQIGIDWRWAGTGNVAPSFLRGSRKTDARICHPRSS
jgi:hypothetical protein